ncbi:MAG: 16S rRNA (guanine(966)-N(2))-methyltransferase RsmD [Dongiaceae bacterium]
MRIVAGRLKGRRIAAPEGTEIRPTSDRARESLFNILAHNPQLGAGEHGAPIRDAIVLDAFAGSGALGFEALSRGAAHAIFLDNEFQALRSIKANAETLGELANVTILKADATRPPMVSREAGRTASLVFLDPPYGKGLAAPALVALAAAGWIAPDAIVSVEVGPGETGPRENFAAPEGFVLIDARRYGKATITLLRYEG